jgi:predicted enzyme related to lactoylglutathione lyase
VTSEEGGIAGGIGKSHDGGEGGATFYVDVDDIDAALSMAERLGGRTVMRPRDVPGGITIAQLADPEGHVVGLSMSNIRP